MRTKDDTLKAALDFVNELEKVINKTANNLQQVCDELDNIIKELNPDNNTKTRTKGNTHIE